MNRHAFGVALIVLAAGAAQAAPQHQDWQTRHQDDRFVNRVMMQAWADADSGPARLTLYCDTENGFRVMLMPHRALMPEGPAQVRLQIDRQPPVSLSASAFGDEETDVVTLYGTAPVQSALAKARHVTLHYAGGGASGEMDFTFGGLEAGQPMVMKVCPLR